MKKLLATAIVMTVIAATGCSQSESLFNGQDLEGWVEVGSDGAWSVDQGVLTCNGKKHAYAWLSTDRMYKDFVLELEFKVVEGTNSGVFLRAPARDGRISMEGIECQIKDDAADKDFTDVSGAVFSRIPSSGIYTKPVGEWNDYKITLVGRQLTIELNGHLCSDTDIDTVKPLAENDKPMKDIAAEGYIGLQNHGQVVSFQNVRIREIR